MEIGYWWEVGNDRLKLRWKLMKIFSIKFLFLSIFFFSNQIHAALNEDEAGRRAILELRQLFENVRQKSSNLICDDKIKTPPEISSKISGGDVIARRAIIDLRKRLVNLQSKCGLAEKFVIDLNDYSMPWPDVELRRAILDMSQKFQALNEAIARNNSTPEVSDSQRQVIVQRERQVAIEAERLAEERRRLEAENAQIEQEKKSSRISIKSSTTQPDANGDFIITIQTGADTASLKIDGEEVGGKRDGNYVIKRVARVGEQNSYVITARDVFGNTDSATINVVRQVADSRPLIPRLNPANVKVQQSRDAVAIIIGIENYRRVAKEDFANADAKDFYTYASRALGIKPENIKLLVDDGADDIEMLNAFQNWLPLKVNKGKTDVYVFYSGHGYPSQDGSSLYFLPFNVDKQYLDRTSVKQKEVVAALQKVQAKSITMFIDACYSGQTRGGEVLIAGLKPIALKSDEKAYPPEFTVITASTADQFSSASQDLKHGIFSFYLMKGMEGDADLNKDGKMTSGELQRYLSEMVGRQAMGLNRTQNTQLFGDADRVLVGR